MLYNWKKKGLTIANDVIHILNRSHIHQND